MERFPIRFLKQLIEDGNKTVIMIASQFINTYITV